MNRTDEVATNAPAKSRRARRTRGREWTAGLVALASVLGVALVPALGATPAGATGPSVATLTGHGGATAPALGVPVAEGSAQVNPTYVAYNPANGDTAIASTNTGSVFVYLIAGSSEANEYNIETSNAPVTNGPLVAGDVYVMAGTGTAGLIAQPGNNQFGNSTSPVATSNPIEPTSVAFDPNGNVLIAGESSSGASAIQVVAETTGTFYGVSMTAGDLYTIGDVGLSGSPASAINMGSVAAAANGMSVDATGNIVVGDGDGVVFVNEQSSGSLTLYGLSIAHQSAAVIAGTAQGGTDCAPGATSDPANSLYFQSAEPTFDSADNVYFSDNEIGGVNGGGCAWVEPAHSGTLDGLSVTAGNVYKLAGNGGTTATSDGTAGVQSNVAGTSEMTLDAAGNVVLAVQSGTSFGTSPAIQVLAESTGTYYGTSMTAGDIYTVAGGPSNLLATLSGPTSILNAGGGNLLFTDGAATSANLDELSGAPTAAVAPTVTGVAPNMGPTGTSVTVTGTNLTTGSTAVHFGANAATGVIANSATSLTATSPAGTGTVHVTVTTSGGTSPANPPADEFTYLAPPSISSVAPNTGPTTGGTSITISGTNLSGATAITVGGAALTSVVDNATSITGITPTGAAGAADVVVTTAGGTAIDTGAFTYFAGSAGGLTALTPARILDTRNGTGGISGPVASDHSISLNVEGVGGVPASGVSAVVLNVTVTAPSANGHLTVYPDGASVPTTSNLNFSAGETVPNLVIATVGSDGKVDFFNGSGGTVQVLADVSGWFASGTAAAGGLTALTPARILDTRNGTGGISGPVASDHSISLNVEGVGGVPASGVSAVVLNVTVTAPSANGHLTVYPDGASVPTTSNLNFSAGETVPNLVIATVGSDGKVDFFNGSGGTVQVLADVSGWFASGTAGSGGLTALTPARILDTRNGTGGISGPVASDHSISLNVEGVGGVPASGVSAVVLNVTVTAPSANGHLTVYPDGASVPTTSNLNFSAGETVPNLVIATVGSDGKVDFFNGSGGTVQVLADLSGWFS